MEMTITGFSQAAPTPAGAEAPTGKQSQGEFPEALAHEAAKTVAIDLAAVLAAVASIGNSPESASGEAPVASDGASSAKAEDWKEKLNIVAAEALGIQLIAFPNPLDAATTTLEVGNAAAIAAASVATPPSSPVPLSGTPLPAEPDGSAQTPGVAEQAVEPPKLAVEKPDEADAASPVVGGSAVGATAVGEVGSAQANLPNPRSRVSSDLNFANPPSAASAPAQVGETRAVADVIPSTPPRQRSASGTAVARRIEKQLQSFLKAAGTDPAKAAAILESVREVVTKSQNPSERTGIEALVSKLAASKLPASLQQAVTELSAKLKTPASMAGGTKATESEMPVLSESPAVTRAAIPELGTNHSALKTLAARALAEQLPELATEREFGESPLLKVEPFLQAAPHPQFAQQTERGFAVRNLQVQSFADQIISETKKWLIDDKPKTITLRLDPPELGSLSITVRTTGSKVETAILASNADVRTWIEENRTSLASALSKAGLELGQMTVGSQARQQSQTNQQHSTPNRPLWRPEHDIAAETVRPTIRWSPSQLDYSV